MLSTDRKEFDAQLEILFGGFTAFLTDPRKEAFWRGLQKMPISTFKRCVDELLGENGSEKLPTVNAVWKLSRQLRQGPVQPPPAPLPPQDRFTQLANLELARIIFARGASRAALAAMIAEKNRIASQYREIASEERVADDEIREALARALGKAWRAPLRAEMNADRRQFQRIGHITGTEPITDADREGVAA